MDNVEPQPKVPLGIAVAVSCATLFRMRLQEAERAPDAATG
jgi:hypothetical protein